MCTHNEVLGSSRLNSCITKEGILSLLYNEKASAIPSKYLTVCLTVIHPMKSFDRYVILLPMSFVSNVWLVLHQTEPSFLVKSLQAVQYHFAHCWGCNITL